MKEMNPFCFSGWLLFVTGTSSAVACSVMGWSYSLMIPLTGGLFNATIIGWYVCFKIRNSGDWSN